MTININMYSLIYIGIAVNIIMGLIAHFKTIKYMNIWNDCAESLSYNHYDVKHDDCGYIGRFIVNILFFGICFFCC